MNKVLDKESAPVYRLTPEWRLYTSVITTSLDSSFYEQEKERIEKVRMLIGRRNPLFVAQLAAYARETVDLCFIPLMVVAELARIHQGDNLTKRVTAHTVRCADEITELLAYHQQADRRTGTKKLSRLSKQLQAGLQDAFSTFDAHQFAKYSRSAEVCLKDALFLVHPKAKDERQQETFSGIVNDNLPIPYAQETELSALGQCIFAMEEERRRTFRTKWEELIDSGKLGYVTLLRNLRNILEAEVSADHILTVGKRLSSEKTVENSRQLPFRSLAAYCELSKTPSLYATMLMTTLERAVQVSARNITRFGESTRVLIACDVSGSMQCSVSAKSKVLYYNIGLLLEVLLGSRCEQVMMGVLGDRWEIINLPDMSILSNVDAFYKREGEMGYSTNGYLVIKDLIDRKAQMDKIMMFIDCQLWNSHSDLQITDLWRKYKKVYPTARLYLFDLSGYGNTPLDITRGDVSLITGWSDKILDILSAIDKGNGALQEIEKIVI